MTRYDTLGFLMQVAEEKRRSYGEDKDKYEKDKYNNLLVDFCFILSRTHPKLSWDELKNYAQANYTEEQMREIVEKEHDKR